MKKFYSPDEMAILANFEDYDGKTWEIRLVPFHGGNWRTVVLCKLHKGKAHPVCDIGWNGKRMSQKKTLSVLKHVRPDLFAFSLAVLRKFGWPENDATAPSKSIPLSSHVEGAQNAPAVP